MAESARPLRSGADQKLVAAENPAKPLSDSKIATLLADQASKSRGEPSPNIVNHLASPHQVSANACYRPKLEKESLCKSTFKATTLILPIQCKTMFTPNLTNLSVFSTTLITFKSFYVLKTAPDRRSYAPRKPSRNSRPRGR